jgi:hypothetical protein
MTSGRFLKTLTSSDAVQSARFTDEKAVVVQTEGGGLTVFDATAGEELMTSPVEARVRYISYQPDCRRILIWNEHGQVVRYAEGRYFFDFSAPPRVVPTTDPAGAPWRGRRTPAIRPRPRLRRNNPGA